MITQRSIEIGFNMATCIVCPERCEAFKRSAQKAASGDCPRKLFGSKIKLPGSSTDHEKEAAGAGQAADCCGAGNEKRGARS